MLSRHRDKKNQTEMAPKSYEVTLPKIEKHENPTLEVSVIGFPQAIDNKLKVVSYEEALREIGKMKNFFARWNFAHK